jgi:2-amino-4-hydroxy-6-hydroxymethyldihydropteridine diphosphokinase
MVNRVFVLLGSNIEKETNLPAAARLLIDCCRVIALSQVYETAPVGLEEQPQFLNAAALVETELSARLFREQILARIERKLNRVRTTDKNAPRTIDADIILFDRAIFDLDKDHHIPDPDLLKFPHVAIPVAELAPDMPHPESGEPLAKIAARLVRQQASDTEVTPRPRPDLDLSALLDH